MTRDLRQLILSLGVWALGEGMFLYIYPLYIRDLGATPAGIGGVLGIAGASMAVLHLPAGYLADRFGRKPVMIAGWYLGMLAAMGMFLAPNLLMFSIGLTSYFATAFVISANNSYITASRGSLSLERALTLVTAAYGAGLVISPAIGGWIASLTGLRSVFGWASLMLAASCAMLLPLSPQPVEPKKEGRRYGRLLGSRTFLGLVVLFFGTILAMYLGLPLAPNFLQQVRAVPVATIGLLGSANALGLVLFSVVLGRRHPRWGWILGQVFVFASALVLWLGAALPLYFLGYFLRGGFGAAKGLATSQIGRVVDNHEMGLAYAVTETASAAALIISPVLAGVLFERRPDFPFIVSAVLVAVSILFTIRFAPARDRHSQLPVEAG
ncbi:MAG: MFS transporter [Chloroflexi bacterium]|nr:MFS transporter [Chloroflexota bacterium]